MTGAPNASQIFLFGGFSLDARQRLLFGPDGRPVPMTVRAFETLLFLVEHPDRLLDKQTLMQAIWPNLVVEENNLNRHISMVRRALGEKPGEHRFIVTVPGRGFRFVQPVTHPVSLATEPKEHWLEPPVPLDSGAAREPSPPARPVAASHRSRFGPLLAICAVVASVVLLAIQWKASRVSGQNSSAASEKSVAVASPSIAVLPFADLSADGGQDYFADGLSEELMHELMRLPNVRVIGRTSAFAFKGKHEDARTVGRTLGVDHVLDGSVRRSGDDLRIAVQLIDATNGAQLWSSTYARKRGDIFAIQDDIAKSVAEALRLALRPDWQRGAGGTRDAQAYEAYLVSSAMISRLAGKDLKQVAAELEGVVARDPDFALAWATLARVYSAIPDLGLGADSEWYRKSLRATTRALELAPDSPRVLTRAAEMSIELRDWAEAERRLKKALELSGGQSFDENMTLGWFLENLGRMREAAPYLLKARELDPFSPRASITLESHYLALRDFASADAQHVYTSRIINPLPFGNGHEVLRAMGAGDRASLEKLLAGDTSTLGKAALLGLQDSRRARIELRRFYANPANQASTLEMDKLAHWATYFGDTELALQALHEVFGPSRNVFYLWRPDFSELRRTPGFKEIVRDLGLVEYWRASGAWGEFCRPVGATDFTCV